MFWYICLDYFYTQENTILKQTRLYVGPTFIVRPRYLQVCYYENIETSLILSVTVVNFLS